MKLRLIKAVPSTAARTVAVSTDVFDYVFLPHGSKAKIALSPDGNSLDLGSSSPKTKKALALAAEAIPVFSYRLKKFILDYQGAAFLRRKFTTEMVEQLSPDGHIPSRYDGGFNEDSYFVEIGSHATVLSHLRSMLWDHDNFISFSDRGTQLSTKDFLARVMNLDQEAAQLKIHNFSPWVPNHYILKDYHLIQNAERESTGLVHTLVSLLENPEAVVKGYASDVDANLVGPEEHALPIVLNWKLAGRTAFVVCSVLVAPGVTVLPETRLAQRLWQTHIKGAYQDRHRTLGEMMSSVGDRSMSDDDINRELLDGFKLVDATSGARLDKERFDEFIKVKYTLVPETEHRIYTLEGHSFLYGPNLEANKLELKLENILE